MNEDIQIINSLIKHFEDRTEIKQLGTRIDTEKSSSVLIGYGNQRFTITVSKECE